MTGPSEGPTAPRDSLPPNGLVVLARRCFGATPCFSRSLTDAGMAPYTVAFYRYGLSALVLSPLLLRVSPAQFRALCRGIFPGVTVGLGWIGAIYMTSAVFSLLIDWLWFQDHSSRPAPAAASMIIVAAFLASSPAAVEPRHLPVMLLPPVALAAPGTITSRSLDGWWLIAGLALGTALLPQLVYTTFAPQIGAALSAVAGRVEPPTMFQVGWLLTGESVTSLHWLACLLVTLAIVITPTRAMRNLSTRMVLPRKPGANSSCRSRRRAHSRLLI